MNAKLHNSMISTAEQKHLLSSQSFLGSKQHRKTETTQSLKMDEQTLS